MEIIINDSLIISGGGADSRSVKFNGFVSIIILVINEIFSDGDGDANNDGFSNGTFTSAAQDQFIELVNIGNSNIDLDGFKIYEGSLIRHTFDPFILHPNEAMVVFGGGSLSNFTNSPAVLANTCCGLAFVDAFDDITVNDESGNRVDEYAYGQEAADDQSIARNPDYVGPFVKHSLISTNPVNFSPGKENTTGDPLPVELSSFDAITTETGIELDWRTETEVGNYGFNIERRIKN